VVPLQSVAVDEVVAAAVVAVAVVEEGSFEFYPENRRVVEGHLAQFAAAEDHAEQERIVRERAGMRVHEVGTGPTEDNLGEGADGPLERDNWLQDQGDPIAFLWGLEDHEGRGDLAYVGLVLGDLAGRVVAHTVAGLGEVLDARTRQDGEDVGLNHYQNMLVLFVPFHAALPRPVARVPFVDTSRRRDKVADPSSQDYIPSQAAAVPSLHVAHRHPQVPGGDPFPLTLAAFLGNPWVDCSV
jgi:hypothetical protein